MHAQAKMPSCLFFGGSRSPSFLSNYISLGEWLPPEQSSPGATRCGGTEKVSQFSRRVYNQLDRSTEVG